MQPHFLRPVCFEGVASDDFLVSNGSLGNCYGHPAWWPLEGGLLNLLLFLLMLLQVMHVGSEECPVCGQGIGNHETKVTQSRDLLQWSQTAGTRQQLW